MRIVVVDVTGNTWESDRLDGPRADVEQFRKILMNWRNLDYLIMVVNDEDWYFNPANIIAVKMVDD